jgi:hypothetical protein
MYISAALKKRVQSVSRKSFCSSDFSLCGDRERGIDIHQAFCVSKAKVDSVVVVVLCFCLFGLSFGELLCKKGW